MTPGNLVGVNDPAGLVTITQIQPIRVGFTLAERDLAALRKASAASSPAAVRVYAPGTDEALATGTLDFVDSSVDFSSGTIAAKAKFANEKLELWPGTYVDVGIDLGVRPKTVMIPAVAIQSGQKGPFVFVAKDDQTVEDAQYRACRRRRLSRRVSKGLEGGERVDRRGTDAPDQRRTCYQRPRWTAGSRRQPEEQDERQKRIRRRGCAMNISEFCIRHPVATTLMSAALVTAGFFAYFLLPGGGPAANGVSVINVSASLPGASPDTMANAVATPLIKQFSTISGIDTISATSALSSTSIAIQFNLNRDIDSAAADVQSAIARVQRQLPTEMTEPPSYRKVNPADAPILILTLRSDIAPLPEMDAFAQQVISPALSTIDGVAQVQIFGSQKYAVRVQLDPGCARGPRDRRR